MKYLEIKFLCRLTSNAYFSAYKGSMLRGCLGANLRKGLCMARKQNCTECILAENCIFQRIFTPLPFNGITRTAPFCLEPDLDEKRVYAAGEAFGFRLKLFSYGVEYLPFFVQAFRMAGEKGLGTSREPGTFIIEDIICQGKSIYDLENDNLTIPQPQRLPEIKDFIKSGGDVKLLLHLHTPLRHKNNNHFTASLDFIELFHLILRRIKALHHLDGTSWSMEQKQYEILRKAADDVEIITNGLHWHDWTRYSSRQEAYMKFGGLLGTITYKGNLSIFRNLLQIASIAHIGKQTSFGLGWLEFRYF